MTLEMETSRAIAAQLLRHRSFVFQEFSQRYQVATDFCTVEARLQDSKNRQNSLQTDDEELAAWFMDAQDNVQTVGRMLYEEALAKGIAKEQARFLLPLSTKTRLYMTGNIRSWIHYIQLRSGIETQKEHRELALEAKRLFCEQFPLIASALEWTAVDLTNKENKE
jgi:thymidylate synthase (FAD)